MIEQGDLYFFFRSGEHAHGIQSLSDINNFYMIMSPADEPIIRLIEIREKSLPAIPDNGQLAKSEWARIAGVSIPGPNLTVEQLGSIRIANNRTLPPAIPVAVATYQLISLAKQTELIYFLEAPTQPGPIQDLFNIAEKASIAVRIRNPQGSAHGYPGAEVQPDYPDVLIGEFNGQDWLPAQQSELLNYPDAQLVLTGVHHTDLEKDLGLTVQRVDAKTAIARLYQTLSLSPNIYPQMALQQGTWPEQTRHAA